MHLASSPPSVFPLYNYRSFLSLIGRGKGSIIYLMPGSIISLRDIRKDYKKTPALKGIDLDISPSEITGIIGPDGAGKSTLLKICSGILRYSGSVRYKGHELSDNPELIKSELSFMPQGIGQNLYSELTVEENIDFFASLKKVPADMVKKRKERLLKATGLEPFRQRLAGHLSGGMKQKLGICCSLISMPEILILDEPSTGIDPLSRRQLWDILNEYLTESGTTIIFGTSYMDEAERCHLIMFLHKGRSIYKGPPERLMEKNGGLEDAFFGLLTEAGESAGETELPPEADTFDGDREIVVNEVTKYYGDFRALDKVSLTIRPGEIFGLLGPNGAGKTTLIKCMVGLLKPDKGDIVLAGLTPGSAQLRYRIGYMSQIFSLYGDLTVKENIQLYGSIYGLKRGLLTKRMEWIIRFSGLGGYENALVKALPGGMKQRLALGCATIHLPSVLFLDEPTSGVDPVARRSFWQFIRMLSGELGTTVIVTTHNLIEADFCDRVAIMDEGRIIALDKPEVLRDAFRKVHGDVFEIYPAAPVREEFFTNRGVSIVPFGRRYHLWKKGIDEKRLEEMLKEQGIGYHYIRKIKPPMEDVFIDNLQL